jgi:hypothetical protein
MNRPNLLAALATYVEVLARSADATTRAEDRVAYQRHLAATSRLFRAIQRGEAEAFEALLRAEESAFGWSYLCDSRGAATERAWAVFVAAARGAG